MTPVRYRGAVTALLSLAAVPWVAGGAQAARPIAYNRYVLSNGLVAVVNEDHSVPVVAIDVVYHVGAKDERRGQTGLAHLCEHLMGEGSPNEPVPEKVFIQSIGGVSAHWASTSEDVTHYFATVPSNQLETMLWMESDRMAAPLTRLDSARMAAVRTVVGQERAQNVEAQVFGSANGLTARALFGPDSPSIDPLGPMTDLDAATPEDVKEFCLPYYVPNNAVVALSGDVSPQTAETLITKYFGGIQRAVLPRRTTFPMPAPRETVRVALEDPRAKASRIRFVWRAVGFVDPDKVPLSALASILSRDRTGRLSKTLVYDLQLATRVNVDNVDLERGGLFQIEVFPRQGVSLTRIEAVVDSVLDGLTQRPATALELEAFARSNAVVATTTLQTRSMRADTLAHGEVFAGDPVAYAKQGQRAFALTPGDIARVARQYLRGRRVVMSMVPAGKLDLISRPDLPFTNVTPSKVVP